MRSQVVTRLVPLVLACLSPKMVMAQGAAPNPKEQSAELNNLFTKSMEAFGKGDFATTITGLKEMIAKGAEGPGTESLYFTIAASHFNLKQYQESKAAFEEYLKKYPSGTKVMEAQTAIAQCQVNLGDKQGAIKAFADIAQKPGVNKEKMLLIQANLLRETKQLDQAVALLRPAVTGLLLTDESVQLAGLLASLEVQVGNPDNAFKLLNLLYARFDVVDNPLSVNILAFEVGDAMLNRKEYKAALRAYSLIRRKEDILNLQRQKLQSLVSRYDGNLATIRQDPSKLSQLQAANVELKNNFEEGKKMLEEVEKAEDFMTSLRFRQARAYQELKKPWGTIVLFESLLDQEKKPNVREDMLFSILNSHAELKNQKELDKVMDQYLKEFPKGKYADAAQHMRGIQMLQKNDLKGAETLFGSVLKNGMAGDKLEITLFLLGNSRFGLQEYPAALEAYEEYIKKFPKGEYLEETKYRRALCLFFKGDYEKAVEALQAYQKEKPDGIFAPDAGYRIAACYMVAERLPDVIRLCLEWEKDWGANSLMPEVMSLLGDAYAMMEKRQEAAAAYERGLQMNGSDRVLNYLLFEANKQYQKLGQWDKSTALFKGFIARNPKHPAVVASMFWLAKALAKEGKPEEAKEFLSEKIYSFIKDRKSDSVEQLLTQLAQMCAKKPRPVLPKVAASAPQPGATPAGGTATTATATPTAAPAPSPAEATTAEAPPPPPPYDAEAELDKYLSMKKVLGSDIAKARVYFARAELAKLTRKPKESAEWLDKICTEIAPKELGAMLLAQSGDRMLERREIPKALAFYKELATAFPESDLVEFAYNGQGQIALLEGKPQEAMKWFNEAVDKIGATATLKDVTLGKGKALLAMDKLEEAKAVFEQVGATKEWKGYVTAESVYYLGEIAFQKQDYTNAAQFFQRVFVAYQRYPLTVARAYLRAADTFEKLGDPEKAKAHLREMLTKEKLAALPEFETARKRLEGAQ